MSNNVPAHPQLNPLQLGTLTTPTQLCDSIKINCRIDLFGDSFVHQDSKAHSVNAFKEVGHQCHQFHLEELQKLLYTTLQFFTLTLARFEGRDYFFSAILFVLALIFHVLGQEQPALACAILDASCLDASSM